MLNNKASNDNGRCFLIPSQIKQSYSYQLLHVLETAVCYCYRDGIFQNIL
jgi:hypothetical protein